MVIIITIYKPSEADFTHNGLGTLSPTSCQITEEINGQYTLTLEHPRDPDGKWERIGQGCVIKAPGPKGDQLFRVCKVQKSINGGLAVDAMHIFYDLLDNFIADIYPTQKNGDQAAKAILAGCQYPSGFTASSDITAYNNARLVRMNPVTAFMGDEDQAFINRWGGEIERDNFNIALKVRRGADQGVSIRYRKNLLGLTLTEDYSQVKTRIMPTGLYENDTVFIIPDNYGGPYIDSPHLSDYPRPKIAHAHFSDIKIGAEADGIIPYPTGYDAYVELKKRIMQLYAAGADLPQVTLEVEFADLTKTAEYAGLSALETVQIGDTVRVIHEGLGVDYSLRMTSYTWDCLRGRYVSATFGDRPENLGDTVNSTDIDLSILNERVDNAIMAGTKYNKVYITHDEGFVAETADGKAKTHMSATDGFVAEAQIGNQWAKTVITGGEPLSVYYGGKLIGGLQLSDGQLVFVANRITNTEDMAAYLEVGRDSDGYAGMRFYDATKNDPQTPVITIFESDNNRSVIDSQRDIILGAKVLSDGTKQPKVAVNRDGTILLNGDVQMFGTLDLRGLTEICPHTGAKGYSGIITVGDKKLDFYKGILVSATNS